MYKYILYQPLPKIFWDTPSVHLRFYSQLVSVGGPLAWPISQCRWGYYAVWLTNLIIWFADHLICWSSAQENGKKSKSMSSTPSNRGCYCHALSGDSMLIVQQYILEVYLWSRVVLWLIVFYHILGAGCTSFNQLPLFSEIFSQL